MSVQARTASSPSAIAPGAVATQRRGRGDWLSLLLLLSAVFCVASAIHEIGWAAGTGFLIWGGLLVALLGHYLATSPLPSPAAGVIGVVLVLEVVLIGVGSLWPPLSYVSADLADLGQWLERARWGQWAGLGSPLPEVTGYVWRQSYAIFERVWFWLYRAFYGQSNEDQRVWLLLVASGLFLVTLFSTWQLFRRWRASLAVVPLGIAIGLNGFLAGQSGGWVLGFLGIALVLMVRGRSRGLELRWQRQSMDYSDELLPYTTLVGTGLAAIVIILAPLVPALSSRATYDAFWRVLRSPWERVEDTTGRLFGGLNSPGRRESMLPPEGAAFGMSDEHSVGAGRPQGDDIVMYVQTTDPAPEPWAGEMPSLRIDTGPQRHWRGGTYDTYTGAGWENSSYTTGDVLDAGEPLPVEGVDWREEFVQSFRMRGRTGAVYAAGQPLSVDRRVGLTRRDDGDVVSLEVDAYEYEVVSLVPKVTVSELEAAGGEYPDWVMERYLPLPPLTQRVRDVVAEVTAGHDTPYRKARAIESYLRQFPYDLDVPAPPADREVVDYFLFDLQSGFCDYYATAMTVMLRQAGIPARLAIGYTRGEYDRDRGAWVVTERNSHAWVEAYFPGYGWIEFEPTSGETVYSYPLGGSFEFEPPAVPTPSVGRTLRWPLTMQQTRAAVGGLALAFLLVSLMVRLVRRGRRTAADAVADSYAGMLRALAWVGPTQGSSETVREFWQRLRATLEEEAIFVSTPWGTEWVWQYGRITQPLRFVMAAYERSLFAPGRLSHAVARRARDEVGRLRRELALLWLARRLGE